MPNPEKDMCSVHDRPFVAPKGEGHFCIDCVSVCVEDQGQRISDFFLKLYGAHRSTPSVIAWAESHASNPGETLTAAQILSREIIRKAFQHNCSPEEWILRMGITNRIGTVNREEGALLDKKLEITPDTTDELFIIGPEVGMIGATKRIFNPGLRIRREEFEFPNRWIK